MTKKIENYKKYLYWSISDLDGDLELFNKIVLSNLEKEIAKELTEKDLEEYFKDETNQDYAVQIAVNSLTSKYKSILYSRSLTQMEGYLLPAIDLITGGKERFGQKPQLKGMKLPFLTMNDNGLMILTINKWGASDTITITRRENMADDIKIPIPYFYRVRIRVSESTGDKKISGFVYNLQSIDNIDDNSKISLTQLKESFEQLTVAHDQIGKSDKNEFILIGDVRWRYANPLELWTFSEVETIKKFKYDKETNQVLTEVNSATGQIEKVSYDVPKPIADPKGQPFIQEKFGAEPPEYIECFNLQMSVEDRNSETIFRANLFNNRVGNPQFWIFSKAVVFDQASQLGDYKEDNSKENPYNVINQSYMGTELYVLGNVTDLFEDKDKKINIGVSASMIVAKDFDLLPPKQIRMPFDIKKSLVGTNIPDGFFDEIRILELLGNDVTVEEDDFETEEIADDKEEDIEDIKYSQKFLEFIHILESLFQSEGESITMQDAEGEGDIDADISRMLIEEGYLELDGQNLFILKPFEPFPELLDLFEVKAEAKKSEKKPSKKKPDKKKKPAVKDNVIMEDVKDKLEQQKKLEQAEVKPEDASGLTDIEKKELEDLKVTLTEIMKDPTFHDVSFEDLLNTGVLGSNINTSHKNLVEDILKEIKG